MDIRNQEEQKFSEKHCDFIVLFVFLPRLIKGLSMKQMCRMKKSVIFGIVFFAIIPIFALINWLWLPDSWHFPSEGIEKSYWNFLYFSIVSITTLGFGDIYPITTCSRIVVSLESILGVLFIGLFLNSLSSEQAQKVASSEKKRNMRELKLFELNKLLLRKEMLDIRIERYMIAMYNVVTPIKERKVDRKINIDEIKFNNMYDMFNHTTLLTEDFRTSSLEMFMRTQDELYTEISDIIKTVNVGYWMELLKPMNRFLTNCVEFGFKDSLLGIKTMKIENEPASVFFSKIIKDHTGKLEYSPSNAKNQFIALYNLIIDNYKAIEMVQQTFNGVNRDM